jgi:hypothetical protein
MYVFKNSYLGRIDGAMRLRKVLDKLGVVAHTNSWFGMLTKAFLQVSMPDFDSIYYFALAKYKIK